MRGTGACVGPRFALCGPARTRDKVQTPLVQLRSVCADSCVTTSFSIMKMSRCCQREKGFLHVLGSYNGNIETGKNGDLMKIGVEALEATNSRMAAKWRV